MSNGYRLTTAPVEEREDVAHYRSQGDVAAFDQRHDRGGGIELGDRGERPQRLGVSRNARRGLAKVGFGDKPAVDGYRQGAAIDLAVADKSVDQGTDCGEPAPQHASRPSSLRNDSIILPQRSRPVESQGSTLTVKCSAPASWNAWSCSATSSGLARIAGRN